MMDPVDRTILQMRFETRTALSSVGSSLEIAAHHDLPGEYCIPLSHNK